MFCAKSALAFLEITEIMYDPKGSNADHQWIEVHNTDSNAVAIDAGTWRFNDGSGHYMNDKVDFSIPASSYVIITGNKSVFLSDHAGYSGMVIDTSMSLDKDGDTTALTNNGSTITSVTYTSSMGASENGDSLQKINGTWKGSSPTPGLANTDTGSNNEDVLVSAVPDEKIEDVKKIITFATKIISPTRVTTNISFPFSAKTTNSQKEVLNVGRFVWNFGDGMTVTRPTSEPFDYTYAYSGEYVVTLSFYLSVFSEIPEATDRITVNVVPAGVEVSGVGDLSDPYVEIKNISGGDADISKWILKGTAHSFVLPASSVILSSKKIRLGSRVTGFDSSDLQAVVLQSPTGEVFSEYPKRSRSRSVETYKYNSENTADDPLISGSYRQKVTGKNDNVVDLNDLGASAIGARSNSHKLNTKSFVPFLGLFVVLCIGATTIILLRKQKSSSDMEDNLRAEDMTIIE